MWPMSRSLPKPYWVADLIFDSKTGEFAYKAVLEDYSKPIADQLEFEILAGNAVNHTQDERNRAREFVKRLCQAFNGMNW